ncbi:cadmium-translocating P-type ATPase [Actinoplanes sp. TBRC 11911]|uniref:heavy metal translocating P-type ATPase n=1 Tax=Actinoplanes sp. TBRC 11911 TaxID=2729386 RepID=UPI00145D57BF|nr:heavy metal translocating P-type ATPase [Actinoplanes sp. TBRC 11911]NMO55730.1 cadmium-translocating P-type ATPase [Actinoplanes sp. TBRC 11911]
MRWAAASLVLFLVGLLAHVSHAPASRWGPLFAACYLAGGWEPALAGLKALRDKTLDVDLLMIVAAIGAAAIGQVIDGGLLIVIFATSGALEALATARTQDSVRGLLDLAPETATRIDADGESTVARADLAIGDVILVRPGERIGADGRVVTGASEVDQATITGEALPVDKSAGDDVFAGTVNGTGALRVRVGRAAGDSVVARIASLVEQAATTKARTQLFIEKVEQRYSVGVVAATLALFFLPLAFGRPLTETLLRAMTFMIVASPCAVVLATMPPLLAAIANAGRHGVLVKSAVVMERLGSTDLVAFDKTGTLTRGTPKVVRIVTLDSAPWTENEVLAFAAAAEHPSEHPLATAVVAAARERGLPIGDAQDFVALPGRGVRARVDGFVVEIGAATGDVRTTGYTTVVVMVDGHEAGLLAISDEIRAESIGAVERLSALTGRPPLLLTGDNQAAARRLADVVGIRDVRAGLLPADKVTQVRALQRDGRRVTVVGDGVNDAPALAAAHAGIAMGGAGADLTVETADAVVVRDDLHAIPAVVDLSRRAHRVVVANLVIAATVIVILVALDLAGRLPLPLGVAGHEGSTVIVGLNGLRLLRR